MNPLPILANLVTELVVVGIVNTIFLVLFVVAGIRQKRNLARLKERD